MSRSITASSLFMRTGVLAALCGMSLGMFMGARQDFTFHSVHAHINLVGWASMFLFGLFYRTMPAADGKLALTQYGFAITGLLIMIPGVALIASGSPEYEPVAAIGSVLTVVSMILFATNVFRATRMARPGTMPPFAAPAE